MPAAELPERIGEVRPVPLCGHVEASMQLSGVVVAGDHLVLGADEGHHVHVLKRRDANGCWQPERQIALAKQDQEADVEALTYGDGHLYVVGSHSRRRRRMKPELSARKNRERLLQVEEQESRNRVFRIPFDAATGALGKADHISLSKRLRKDPLLGQFYGLPGKENGIDIEGMAYRDGILYLGFRGPVLRDNFVPVMLLDYDRPKAYEVRFVRLAGQGIRDMAALGDGFLILTGPVNDAPGPFQLWWWDGQDQVPGRDRSVRDCVLLGPVSAPGGAKAEGLAVLSAVSDSAELLLLYETSTSAQAVSMRVGGLPLGGSR
jgi:hypothetical protein